MQNFYKQKQHKSKVLAKGEKYFCLGLKTMIGDEAFYYSNQNKNFKEQS